ncbi:MAG: DUF192 domain-containing protein [Alphaproteobacteria bacterium]|nr:DUF192 domain-containing protein [Alphaproteobacteria bacterium]
MSLDTPRHPVSRRALGGLLLGFGALPLAPRLALAQRREPAVGPLSPLVIVTAAGQQHRFRVELAADDQTRARGLMFRKELPADQGMLFDYGGTEREVAMWMQNTLIPLDMLFIRADATILSIAERTVPLSTDSIYAGGPVRAVLELNGGTVARLGIRPGDRVLHKVFGNLP